MNHLELAENELTCLNCKQIFLDTAKPVFIAELILIDKKISVNICPACMNTEYIQGDRIIKKAFQKIGHDFMIQKPAGQVKKK